VGVGVGVGVYASVCDYACVSVGEEGASVWVCV